MITLLCLAALPPQVPEVAPSAPPILKEELAGWDLSKAERLPVDPQGFSDVVFDRRGMDAWLALDDGRIWTVNARGEFLAETKLPEPWDLEALCPTPDGRHVIGLEEKLGVLLVLESPSLRYLHSTPLPDAVPHGKKGPEGLWILDREPPHSQPWEVVIGNQQDKSLHFCPWAGVDAKLEWRGKTRLGDEARGLHLWKASLLLAVMDDRHELWEISTNGGTPFSAPLPKRLEGVEGVTVAPDGSLWLVEDEGGLWSCPVREDAPLPWVRFPVPEGLKVDSTWELHPRTGRLLGPDGEQALQPEWKDGRWSGIQVSPGADSPAWAQDLKIGTRCGPQVLPGSTSPVSITHSLVLDREPVPILAAFDPSRGLATYSVQDGKLEQPGPFTPLDHGDQVLGFCATPRGPALAVLQSANAIRLQLLAR